MPYIDSRDFYELKQQKVTYASVRRAYYGGYPYKDNPFEQYLKQYWATVLSPTEEEKDWPQYYDNLARIIIENTVNDILPSESSLRIRGMDKIEDANKQRDFYRQLFCLPPGYKRTPAGFISWAKKTLIDVAQTGNGLIFLRLIPAEGREPIRVKWDYYAMEAWQAEEVEKGADPAFYRIEYKYDIISSDNKRTTYWHRVDIYRDYIVRYHDTAALINNFDNDIPQGGRITTADTFAGILPPRMSVMQPDETTDRAERDIMAQLGGWVCIPLVWDRKDPADLEGVSALRINRLATIDQVNRLETEWSDAAVQHGNPQEYAVDLELPGEEGGEKDETTRDDFSSRDIMVVESNGNSTQRGTMMYPDNLPKDLLHGAPMESLRRAVFEGAANMGLNPESIGRFGQMSSYGYGLINRSQEDRVKNLREDLIASGILDALERALEMLDAVGQLPASIRDETEPTIRMAGRSLSPDEELKMMTSLAEMYKLSFPEETILAYARKFIDIDDDEVFLKSIKDYYERAAEVLEAAKAAHEANPTPQNQGGKTPGKDNKLK